MKPIKHLVTQALTAAVLLGAAAAAPTAAKADWMNCEPIELYEWTGRIAVKCAASQSATYTNSSGVSTTSSVRFFAIPNTNANVASRFIAVASSALLSGKFFVVNFSADPASNVAGCLASDCRTPTVFGVKNTN